MYFKKLVPQILFGRRIPDQSINNTGETESGVGQWLGLFLKLNLNHSVPGPVPRIRSEQESGPGPGPLLLGACPGGALLSDTEGQDRLPDDKEGKRGAEP